MKSTSATRKSALKRTLAGALVLMMTIGGLAARPAAAAPSSGGFVPVTPYRVVDTRRGQGAPAQPLASGQTLEFGVGGGVPAGASAVALNVTATEPGAPGFLAVFPHGAALPPTSNVNFVAGQTVPNMAVVGLHGATSASLYNFGGPAQVVVDVAGYFTDGFTPTATPRRLLDSRDGAALGAGERRSLPVDVPGATAVVLNVTATNPTAAGYLTVVPRGAATATSSVNFAAGQTVANMVTVGLSGGGFDVANAIGTTDVVVDVFGYYTGDAFRVEMPRRVMDSRTGQCGSRMRPGEERLVTTGTAGAAVALNVTATAADGTGYLTVYPSGSGGPPTASNVNYTAGQNVANMALVGKGGDGYVALFNYGASVDVVVDVVGSFGDAGRADPASCVVVAPPPPLGAATGTVVTRVVDGDTIDVDSGQRVRLIGIDTPEVGQCGYAEASANLSRLVQGKTVTLTAGARDDTDRYGRLLRYVDLPDGTDAGLAQIAGGFAIARYDGRDGYGHHPRQEVYVATDATTPAVCGGGGTGPPPAEPYYANCAAARAAGVAPLYRGQPGYRPGLDGDNDGIACE